MSATVTVLSLLKHGDHFLVTDDVYGGTQRYIRRIYAPMTGIDFELVDFTDLKKFRASIKPNTKLIWVESPTNPMLKCVDIAAIAKIAKEMEVLMVIDNTFMSPALQESIDF